MVFSKKITYFVSTDLKVAMRKTISLLLFIILFGSVSAQQDPQFAHNMYNHLYTNPGYTGMGEGIDMYVINRQQWVGYEGAPLTTLAGVSTKVNFLGAKGGIGLVISDDRFEFEKDFQAKLSYSYHKNLGRGNLGVGLSAGIINFDLNGTWNPPETSAAGDDYIPQDAGQKIVLDLNFGLFYQIKDKFYLGVSSSHLNQPEIGYPNVTASFLRRHYFATVGYSKRLLNSPIEMQPSVFVKYDGTKIQYSGNITALYNKKFWLGVSYRNQDAIYPMLGVNLANGLKVGYTYELSLSKMITVSKGTHEVFLGYSLDLGKINKNYKYKSILYL